MFKRKTPEPPAAAQPAPPPRLPGFGLRVYTPNYTITGRVLPEGALLGWLNNADRRVMVLTQAQVVPLAPDTPVRPAALPAVTVPKDQVLFLEVLDGQPPVRLEPNQTPAALYLGRFVLRAVLRLPAGAPPDQFGNLYGGDFFAVSDAQLHPVLPTRPLDSQPAAVMLVNRKNMDFYHLLAG